MIRLPPARAAPCAVYLLGICVFLSAILVSAADDSIRFQWLCGTPLGPVACDQVPLFRVPCSVSCGVGTRSRHVACYDTTTLTTVPDDSVSTACPFQAPPASERCTSHSACQARWACETAPDSGSYGPCLSSSSFGACTPTNPGVCASAGVRSRSVVCLDAETGALASNEDQCPSAFRPPATLPCTDMSACACPAGQGGDDCEETMEILGVEWVYPGNGTNDDSRGSSGVSPDHTSADVAAGVLRAGSTIIVTWSLSTPSPSAAARTVWLGLVSDSSSLPSAALFLASAPAAAGSARVTLPRLLAAAGAARVIARLGSVWAGAGDGDGGSGSGDGPELGPGDETEQGGSTPGAEVWGRTVLAASAYADAAIAWIAAGGGITPGAEEQAESLPAPLVPWCAAPGGADPGNSTAQDMCGSSGTCNPATGACECANGFSGDDCSVSPEERALKEAACNPEGTRDVLYSQDDAENSSTSEESMEMVATVHLLNVPTAVSSAAPTKDPSPSTVTAKCVCRSNWTGSRCNTPSTCPSSFRSASNTCLNGGTRSLAQDPADPSAAGQLCGGCTCVGPWTGDRCQLCPLRCANGGAPNGDCSACVCKRGWAGRLCACPAVTATVSLLAAQAPAAADEAGRLALGLTVAGELADAIARAVVGPSAAASAGSDEALGPFGAWSVGPVVAVAAGTQDMTVGDESFVMVSTSLFDEKCVDDEQAFWDAADASNFQPVPSSESNSVRVRTLAAAFAPSAAGADADDLPSLTVSPADAAKLPLYTSLATLAAAHKSAVAASVSGRGSTSPRSPLSYSPTLTAAELTSGLGLTDSCSSGAACPAVAASIGAGGAPSPGYERNGGRGEDPGPARSSRPLGLEDGIVAAIVIVVAAAIIVVIAILCCRSHRAKKERERVRKAHAVGGQQPGGQAVGTIYLASLPNNSSGATTGAGAGAGAGTGDLDAALAQQSAMERQMWADAAAATAARPSVYPRAQPAYGGAHPPAPAASAAGKGEEEAYVAAATVQGQPAQETYESGW